MLLTSSLSVAEFEEEGDLLDEALVSIETGDVDADVEALEFNVNGSLEAESNLVVETYSDTTVLVNTCPSGVLLS